MRPLAADSQLSAISLFSGPAATCPTLCMCLWMDHVCLEASLCKALRVLSSKPAPPCTPTSLSGLSSQSLQKHSLPTLSSPSARQPAGPARNLVLPCLSYCLFLSLLTAHPHPHRLRATVHLRWQAKTVSAGSRLPHVCMHAKLLQWPPTLCAPMDQSPPGSSVHGILQARILEWVAVSSCRGSSQPRDRTHVSYVYLHWQLGSLPLAPPGKPSYTYEWLFKDH